MSEQWFERWTKTKVENQVCYFSPLQLTLLHLVFFAYCLHICFALFGEHVCVRALQKEATNYLAKHKTHVQHWRKFCNAFPGRFLLNAVSRSKGLFFCDANHVSLTYKKSNLSNFSLQFCRKNYAVIPNGFWATTINVNHSLKLRLLQY